MEEHKQQHVTPVVWSIIESLLQILCLLYIFRSLRLADRKRIAAAEEASRPLSVDFFSFQSNLFFSLALI